MGPLNVLWLILTGLRFPPLPRTKTYGTAHDGADGPLFNPRWALTRDRDRMRAWEQDRLEAFYVRYYYGG